MFGDENAPCEMQAWRADRDHAQCATHGNAFVLCSNERLTEIQVLRSTVERLTKELSDLREAGRALTYDLNENYLREVANSAAPRPLLVGRLLTFIRALSEESEHE